MTRTGQCLCGTIHYSVEGEPLRIGLCHCQDCRRESGSSFATFAVWPRESFSVMGGVSTYDGRSFCPHCGSRLFNLTEDEAEIRIGSLDDAPNNLVPSYEIWNKRRETWLHPVEGADQYPEDRD